MILSYLNNTLSKDGLSFFLHTVDKQFTPNLQSLVVDIDKYSEKLIANAVLFEAWDENILVGLIAAYFNDSSGKMGFIPLVCVLDAYSNKRIASELLLLVVKYAKKKRFEKISLEVFVGNKHAVNLYVKNGFYEISRNSPVLVMEKILL